LVGIGRRIYYRKDNGEFLFDTGEKIGRRVRDSTVEQDLSIIKSLHPDVELDNIDFIQLEFGEYRDAISLSRFLTVDPKTKRLQFHGIVVLHAFPYNSEKESYTKTEVEEFYNKDYIQFNLRQLLKQDWIQFRWMDIDDLHNRQIHDAEWKDCLDDPYLEKYRTAKIALAKDILDNGTYWPFSIAKLDGKYYVYEGNHRIDAIKTYDKFCGWPRDRRLLCILYPDFFIIYKDKKTYHKVMDSPVKLRMPYVDNPSKPFVEQLMRVGLAKLVRPNVVEVTVNTYHDLFDVSQVYPHWLRNIFYEFEQKGSRILPSKIINSEIEWSRFVEGRV